MAQEKKEKDYEGKMYFFKNSSEKYIVSVRATSEFSYDENRLQYDVQLCKPHEACLCIADTLEEAKKYIKDYFDQLEKDSHFCHIEYYMLNADQDKIEEYSKRLYNNNIKTQMYYTEDSDIEKIVFSERYDDDVLVEVTFDGIDAKYDFSRIDDIFGRDLKYIYEISDLFNHAHMIKCYRERFWKEKYKK